MDGLIDFINKDVPHQMELVKIAQAHHRFVWIHPFGNGNGRVVRLLTYAMLARCGYIDKDGARLLDPAAVFGSNKYVYYDKLSGADDLSERGLEEWCNYMLGGLVEEVKKIDKLLDADFTKKKIIIPAIEYAHSRERITLLEKNMLLISVEKDVVSVADFMHLFPKNISRVNVSHAVRKLRDRKLLEPVEENARRYNLRLVPNNITFAVLKKLDENGFLPPAAESITSGSDSSVAS